MHPDRNSYEEIWKKVIEKEISLCEKEYHNFVKMIPNAKEEIWNRYVFLNEYCKKNYMKDPEVILDRHKVASCYMIAIIMVRPLIVTKKIDGQNIPLAINECLAITVGLSLVRAYILSSIEHNEKPSKEEMKSIEEKLKNGMLIPENQLVNHGDYIENYASELHFAALEGNLNILSIAHELYLLEVYTRTKKSI